MSIFSKKLGIDLGTANTLVYIPGKGIVLNEPSVVAVSEQDNKILAVGLEAKEMIGRTPENIIAYRPMRDGVIADYRVTEAMLRYYIDKALGRWNFFKPEVMVSVPAGVTSTERRAVIEAAIKAGAKSAYVVKEPILAAIGAGIPIYEARGHMIIDIGGGTTDVAVISLGGIVASTSVKCAGDRIDRAIADIDCDRLCARRKKRGCTCIGGTIIELDCYSSVTDIVSTDLRPCAIGRIMRPCKGDGLAAHVACGQNV